MDSQINDIKSMLVAQYNMVLSSRSVLLNYIKTITDDDFIKENSSFGNGSIRNLLVHICDCYAAWIAKRALNKMPTFLPYQDYKTLQDCTKYFEQIDDYISAFMEQYKNEYFKDLILIKDERELQLSALKLFTHVTTHEFHHKGQIMSLSRHLGYTPVDADIIR